MFKTLKKHSINAQTVFIICIPLILHSFINTNVRVHVLESFYQYLVLIFHLLSTCHISRMYMSQSTQRVLDVRCLYIPDKIQLPWQTVFINSSSLKNLRRFMVIIICLCIQISNLIIFSSSPTCLFSGDTSIAQCWPLLSAGRCSVLAHCTLHTPVCTVQSPAPHQSRVHWQCHVKIKWKTVSVHTCDKNAGVYILSKT